jgi:hypothetical protein
MLQVSRENILRRRRLDLGGETYRRYVANTHAASDICSVTTCKSSSGLECDRTSEECPICLSKDDSNGDVYCVDTFIRICPIGSTRCRSMYL